MYDKEQELSVYTCMGSMKYGPTVCWYHLYQQETSWTQLTSSSLLPIRQSFEGNTCKSSSPVILPDLHLSAVSETRYWHIIPSRPQTITVCCPPQSPSQGYWGKQTHSLAYFNPFEFLRDEPEDLIWFFFFFFSLCSLALQNRAENPGNC